MRQVKSKKNKSTELRLIEVFKENGITGWRRNYAVKGHPDFVFLKQKILYLSIWRITKMTEYFEMKNEETSIIYDVNTTVEEIYTKYKSACEFVSFIGTVLDPAYLKN